MKRLIFPPKDIRDMKIQLKNQLNYGFVDYVARWNIFILIRGPIDICSRIVSSYITKNIEE